MSDKHPARTLSEPRDNDEIELEPTQLSDFETAADASTSEDSLAWFDASPAVARELGPLLRTRLRAATGFVGFAYLAFLLFSATNQPSLLNLVTGSLALRGLLALSAFGLLSSRVALTFRQLRSIEYLFFGLDTLLMLATQYTVNIQYVERGDLISMVAFEKNGVLRTFMMMMIYGVFIPTDFRITSRVVLSMAIGPIIVLAMVLHRAQELSALANEMSGAHNVISNSLFLLIGAGLAIFSSHVLTRMRTELREASRLGRYRLLDKIGEGGMGAVYIAEHDLLKRPCALKLITPDLEDNSIAIARFEREVQSAASLSHPNTIQIYDYGHTDDGTFYYVMEYLPGLSVEDIVRRTGPFPPGRAISIIRQVCGALAEAHRLRMTHRDLKPANILAAVLGGKCDVAKVLDFGLVKVPTEPGAPKLTAEFTVSGTPSYMSPEQATAVNDVDSRADIYALGAILYFMLTGKPPFERDSPMSLMIAHASEAVRPPSQLRPDLPADLEAVVLRCLAKSPDERYPDARALSDALGACSCAADWSEAQSEQWWLALAEANEQEPSVPEPVTA